MMMETAGSGALIVVIVMAVVIAYEVVKRYRARLEQASVAEQLAASRPTTDQPKEPAT